MAGERERGQPQPGRPALGPRVEQAQRPRPRARSRTRSSSSRVSSSVKRRSAARTSVSWPARRRRCSPSCGSWRVASTTRSSGRPAGEQALELRERLGRAQLVQVVDHEHDRLVQRAELGDQALDDRVAVELRRRRELLDEPVRAGGGAQLLDHREPEPLRVALAALDRHPGDAIAEAGVVDPRPKQDGLAAPGRRRDQRHATRHAGREPLEQRSPRDQRAPVLSERQHRRVPRPARARRAGGRRAPSATPRARAR